MSFKVSVIGAGNVGATLAQQLWQWGKAEVVLLDIVAGLPQGKALDILQCGAITGSDARITGTNSYADTAASNIVVITSGIPRKPGMSRDDLVATNAAVVRSVTEEVVKHSPDSILILVTNPLDALTQLALKVSGFPRSRVIGQSGVLDAARFATFIADELGVSVKKVKPCLLGGHGDTMLAIPRLTLVNGKPLTGLLTVETVERLVKRAVNGGAEIVDLLKTGSAYYAPAAAAALMVETILSGRKAVLPCAVYLEGEYGLKDVVVGVPVKLGKKGVEEVIELPLYDSELSLLHHSAEAVREISRIIKPF